MLVYADLVNYTYKGQLFHWNGFKISSKYLCSTKVFQKWQQWIPKIGRVSECEALLYAAARVQLLKEEIAPRLENGELVLCDRYIDSSLAYQGYARGLGVEFVEKINDYAVKNFMPDYTVFLSLPPEQAFKRKGGVDKNDRLELSGIEFHNKVYNGYLDLAKKYPERFLVIDASGSKEETHAKIINALKDKGII